MRKRNEKTIHLQIGSEEGNDWAIYLSVSKGTKLFSGYFVFRGKLEMQRKEARKNDRAFFMRRLGGNYMADKVLHHSWIENSSEYTKVTLMHKSEHSNGGVNLLRDRLFWIAKEEWIKEVDKEDGTG